MARNGSGTYSLASGNPVVTGTTIQSTWANNTLDDIATALTASIANDGQTPILANLPMSGYRHTGVGAASARTDYARTDQVQDSSLTWGGSAGGTGDALTLTPTPAITAYSAGQSFTFKATASNTTATTIAISGLSAIAVQVNGAACVGGEITSGQWYSVRLDTTTTAQLTQVGAQLWLGTPTYLVGTNITGTAAALNIGGNAATATSSTNVAGGATGDVLYQSAAGTTAFLSPGATGIPLVSQGAGVAPAFSTAQIAGGGTGATTAAAAAASLAFLANGFVAEQSLASTGITVTGVANAKRLTIFMRAYADSTNGDTLSLQLGTSGGVVTTGYVTGGNVTNTTGYFTTGLANTVTWGAIAQFTQIATDVWYGTFQVLAENSTNAGLASYTQGYISLGGNLDRFKLTPSSSTITAGTVSYMVEY